jgi:single-stranded-DNA-specific exonuclease
VVSETIEPGLLIPILEIDTELKLKEITPKLYRIIKQFEPFGPGNMTPVFITEDVAIYNGDARIVGSSGDHLKLNLTQDGCPACISV